MSPRPPRWERRTAPLVRHEAWRLRTRAGMDVRGIRLPGFASAYAVLAVRYGSLDVALPDGTVLPDGTAHFLEHAMFQKEAGDLFDVFEARGAAANAYTTFTSTAYLFGCTGDFEANLATLLGSVARLEVQAARVAREREIIRQEIALYDDDPGWRGYFNLLQALYRRHPVRRDIAGTAASVGRVRLATLERAHAAFYRPANLLLVVAGDVDPAVVWAQAQAVGGRDRQGQAPRRRTQAEPRGVLRGEVRERRPVSRPHVALGIKDRPAPSAAARAQRQTTTALALDLLFGDGGRIEAPLYREGIVDDSLCATYEAEEDFAHAIVTAEVDDERAFRLRLEGALDAAGREGFGRAELERVRRRALGRYLRTFNAPESAAHWLLAHALEGVPLGARLQALEAATPRTVARRLVELLRAPRAWSIVFPSGRRPR